MVRRVVAADNVLFHQFGEEAVLLNITSETFFRLSGSAVDMWQTLVASASVDQAKDQLLAQYNVDPDVLSTDLNTFIDSLHKAKLIEIRE
ncbi:MAG: PqqD family protein [Chloroflexi bacterium]|nr:PqqD family protein [Chloroflexota bacterium]